MIREDSTTTPESFEQQLRREGYTEFVMLEKQANGHLDTHAHPPESKALIVAGDLFITIGGEERHYGPGSVFHLHAAEEHIERYGPCGVTYFVGRKPLR